MRLRLRLDRRTIAKRTFTVKRGGTRRVTVKLDRAARRKLVRKGSLRVTAVVTLAAGPPGRDPAPRPQGGTVMSPLLRAVLVVVLALAALWPSRGRRPRTVARRGTRRPDPRRRQRQREPVRPVLRGAAARRGPQRVRRRGRRRAQRADAGRVPGRAPRGDDAVRRPGVRPERLGERRRQPDRHAAGRGSRGPARDRRNRATLANAYLKVDGSRAPGAGIVTDTIQFHGTADRYGLNGATSVATLFSDATTATASPA